VSGRTFSRNCEHCESPYEGGGYKYCSIECGNAARSKRRPDAPPKPFDIPALPDDKPEASELLERRKKQFTRK
jgi:hypothetical protein